MSRDSHLAFFLLLVLACGAGLTSCVEGSASHLEGAGAPPVGTTDSLDEVDERDPRDGVEKYLSLPLPDSAEVRRALEALDVGLDLWSGGDRAEGADSVDAALARLPTLADWRPLLRAELLSAAGDTAGVRAALEGVDPKTRFGALWGWEFMVRAHEEAGDSVGARRAAEAAATSDWIEGSGSAAWLRAGRLALAAGDTAAGKGAFGRAIAGEDDPPARTAAILLHRLADDPGPAERLALGRMLLAAEEWNRAHDRLAPLVEAGGLGTREEAELRLGLGRGLVELARPRDAEQMLAPLTGEAIPVEIAGPALYWKGRAALGRDDLVAAEEAFMRIARRAPASPLAEEGILLLLDHGSARGGSPTADRLIGSLLHIGVRSTSGELAAVRFGTTKYLDGDYDGAATTFERYLENGRRGPTRQQAAYWAALAHERRGESTLAREFLETTYREDPLSFYGTFAADRLDAPILPQDLPLGPTPVPGVSDEIANALVRLRVHQRVPTPGSFAHELVRVQEHFFRRGDGAYDLAEALLDDFPVQSMVLGREIHRRENREWNLRLLRIVYPFPYREAVVRESRARGLDPFFVAGLIRQESMFHPSIRSPAGAVGLMQLLPSTASEVARAAGIRFTPALLVDPDVNLRLGTTFLAQMVRRFDGRAEDALSAYNAGPTRARQWRSRTEYRDTDVFLEHIPFRETRHYVKVVQQNTRIYTALYGCGLFEPCTGLSYRAALERSTIAGGAPSSSLAR